MNILLFPSICEMRLFIKRNVNFSTRFSDHGGNAGNLSHIILKKISLPKQDIDFVNTGKNAR